MNLIRHHPYGGGYESPAARRGGSPSGPGPDRFHRFTHDRGGAPGRGRGFGRARGGGSGYGNSNANFGGYDQGLPQGTDGAYSFDNAPAQAAHFQNGNYSGGTPTSTQ